MTIKGITIAINNILLNRIDSISASKKMARSEIIRKAVELYIEKTRKLKQSLSNYDLRVRNDKKYSDNNNLLNVISTGLNIDQTKEIDKLIPEYTISRSEFIRVAILDFLVANINNAEIVEIKQQEKDEKIRIQISPGVYKEYKVKRRYLKDENSVPT